MQKKIWKGILRAFGFLVVIALFIAFIMGLYSALIYFFEGETVSLPKWSWSSFESMIDDFSFWKKEDKNTSSEETSSQPAEEPPAENTEGSAEEFLAFAKQFVETKMAV